VGTTTSSSSASGTPLLATAPSRASENARAWSEGAALARTRRVWPSTTRAPDAGSTIANAPVVKSTDAATVAEGSLAPPPHDPSVRRRFPPRSRSSRRHSTV
jgi:hypothetical protein